MNQVTQKQLDLMDAAQDFATKCLGLYTREQALEMTRKEVQAPEHHHFLIETAVNFVYNGGSVPSQL